ncbi:MAG: hypothetical protein AB1758_24160, partial [Candidatus Eremiobacterota bacterium]
LGCPSCLNMLNPSEQFPVTCRYCGHKVEQEEGERLGKALEGLKGRIQEQLLRGIPASVLVQQVVELGASSEKAFDYVDKIVLDIPFERHKLWRQKREPLMPSTCDSCGVAGELKPYVGHWVVREEERQRYSAGWGGFHQSELTQERPALYFVCKACSKLTPERFAGGYPARNGFTWTRLEAIKENFPSRSDV